MKLSKLNKNNKTLKIQLINNQTINQLMNKLLKNKVLNNSKKIILKKSQYLIRMIIKILIKFPKYFYKIN